jgi:hypothetical protein
VARQREWVESDATVEASTKLTKTNSPAKNGLKNVLSQVDHRPKQHKFKLTPQADKSRYSLQRNGPPLGHLGAVRSRRPLGNMHPVRLG